MCKFSCMQMLAGRASSCMFLFMTKTSSIVEDYFNESEHMKNSHDLGVQRLDFALSCTCVTLGRALKSQRLLLKTWTLKKGFSLGLYVNPNMHTEPECRSSSWFCQFCQSRCPDVRLACRQEWEPCEHQFITCLCGKNSCTARLERSHGNLPVI